MIPHFLFWSNHNHYFKCINETSGLQEYLMAFLFPAEHQRCFSGIAFRSMVDKIPYGINRSLILLAYFFRKSLRKYENYYVIIIPRLGSPTCEKPYPHRGKLMVPAPQFLTPGAFSRCGPHSGWTLARMAGLRNSPSFPDRWFFLDRLISSGAVQKTHHMRECFDHQGNAYILKGMLQSLMVLLNP